MASSARQAGREDKRRRIIEAAVQVFADKGFFGARVSEIAKVAGVADGTIYLYFKNKDDILIRLFQEKMAEILARLASIAEGADEAEAKLKYYVAEHLELAAEQPRLMQVLTVELRQSARFMKDYAHHQPFGRYLAVIANIIEQGQANGAFREDVQPALTSRALFGALDEIALSWVLGGSTTMAAEERAGVAEELSEFFLRGLRTGG
jgi:TetR/AcrR family transcriptional regulator, fatty acid metabolism regulator protein